MIPTPEQVRSEIAENSPGQLLESKVENVTKQLVSYIEKNWDGTSRLIVTTIMSKAPYETHKILKEDFKLRGWSLICKDEGWASSWYLNPEEKSKC